MTSDATRNFTPPRRGAAGALTTLDFIEYIRRWHISPFAFMVDPLKYVHPAIPWAMDWFLGELLCFRSGDFPREEVEAYWWYAAEQSLGMHLYRGWDWWMRDELRPKPNKPSQIGYREEMERERFRVALLTGKAAGRPKRARGFTICYEKLRSSKACKILIEYFEAWAICGERLPWLMLEGKCPVELPEVKL